MPDWFEAVAPSSVVATDREIFVWGGSCRPRADGACGNAARYEPATQRWHQITTRDAPPGAADALAWTGQRVLLLGGPSDAASRSLTLYDPSHDAWERRELMPSFERRQGAFVWTANQLWFWGGVHGEVPQPSGLSVRLSR
jgi:hypothetical protein